VPEALAPGQPQGGQGHVPTLVVFGAEAAAGVLAFALSIRLCPLPAVREELWMRLTAAGVLGEAGGLRRRLASLVLGRPEPAAAPEASP
jgi:hypothetical protein